MTILDFIKINNQYSHTQIFPVFVAIKIRYFLEKQNFVVYNIYMNKNEVIRQLKIFKPLDQNEENDRQQILNFLENNDNCFDRSNKSGHITAGGFVVSSDGMVLLNRHKKLNMWLQFGGHCDGNEDILESALREVEEESGIDSKNLSLIFPHFFNVEVQAIPGNLKKDEPAHFHYDINFLFLSNTKNFQISEESNEIRWFSINEAKSTIESDDKGSHRCLKKIEKFFIINEK